MSLVDDELLKGASTKAATKRDGVKGASKGTSAKRTSAKATSAKGGAASSRSAKGSGVNAASDATDGIDAIHANRTSTAVPLDADPALTLAIGFADRVVHWARASGAPQSSLEALRVAARMTSLATSEGHVCIHVDEIAKELPQLGLFPSDTLLESKMVGTPANPGSHPLILDDQGHLYLHRYFDYERRLARRLVLQANAPPMEVGAAAMEQLDELFSQNASLSSSGEARPNWQKIAAALALDRRLTIISGGPGTGKTTTVVNLLACILAQDPDCRIRLAAPTGKAAARMNEAIAQQSSRLDAAIAERMPKESFTVHRLLGVLPDSSEFRHNIDNPLPIDLLVVDEASMLDLALATKLFEAVPLSARIILLGDKDQLSAVESGAVFSELSADPTLSSECITRVAALTGIPATRIEPPASSTPSGLRDSVVWFSENYRYSAESGIGQFAAMVNKGNAEGAIAWLRAANDDRATSDARGNQSIGWIDDTEGTPLPDTMRRILDGGDAYLRAARRDMTDKAALFDAFMRFRVLCAEREGARGVEGINRVMSRHFRQSLAHPHDPGNRSEWYPGRPVMVLRNDYVLKLFNGDTGLVLPDADGTLMAWFADGPGGFRAISPVRVPPHETAFATTVHKAQGSEFERALLLLPSRPTRVVTRELLYTGVSRARLHGTIVSGTDVLAKAIASPTRRHSGLVDRLGDQR